VFRARDFAEQPNAAIDADGAGAFSQCDANRCESESQASRNRAFHRIPRMKWDA
jgi:hypothetical protein